MGTLSVAFLLPYGEPRDGFFPDTLLAQLCALAREDGHRAEIVRVYYDGRDPARDADVAARLVRWLEERRADVVVLERLLDPAPLRTYRAGAPQRRCVLVARGDSFDPVGGVDWVVGAPPGLTRGGRTRRSPTIAELALAFRRLLAALAAGSDPGTVPGVARVVDGALHPGPPLDRAAPRLAYRPVVEQDVIAPGPPPRVVRKTLFGNAGCPFSEDPLGSPHYAGVRLPEDRPVARLGCAFCCMGGDYEKRPDDEVVADLVEQAHYWTARDPGIEELVLSDQHPLRYLAALVRRAAAAGVRPVRWLFAARPDSWLRERALVEAAVAAAEETGHIVEWYLAGFEAFSDRELARYNKGLGVADLVAAVAEARRLRAAHPESFEYARARGHSLILWNPWTTPEDLAASVTVMRAHGLAELFHDIGRNRLRLYDDLPITYAARRDGALLSEWEPGDEGAARGKGYSVEHPWRFLDGRTRLAYALARDLRGRLGAETELAQLAAVADLARRSDPTANIEGVRREVHAGLAALEARLLGLLGASRLPGAPARGQGERAAVVAFAAGGCQNSCAACANRDRWLDDAEPALSARVDDARRAGHAVALAGREPAVHPTFLALVARAHGEDRRRVGVVSNGRRFAEPGFARSAAHAGLTGASIKIFAPEAALADSIAGARGGHAEALAGIAALREAGAAVEVRAPVHRQNLATLAAYADVAAACGAVQVRVEVALDDVGLDAAAQAADAVDRLAVRCAEIGMALEATPFSAGTGRFEWVPLAGESERPLRGPVIQR